MKENVSEAEMIRRLKEVTADDEKYFPGVLGDPVTFAGRWGLPLSKSYLDFRANQLAAQKRGHANAANGKRSAASRPKRRKA